jgi:hypothetical protein
VCQRQGRVEAGQGLRRIPQQPEGHSVKASAANTRIDAHAEHQRTALIGRVAGDAFLQVRAGSRQRAKPQPRRPKSIVGEDGERRVMSTLRQAQQSVPDLARGVQLWLCMIKPP